jgi:diguanylate cyclase (GGDEF)-like protein/PAS domain S-box-containing protein
MPNLHNVADGDRPVGAILDAALDCVVIMDGRGHVVDWNAAAEHTFGYTRDAAVGREMAELIVPPELRHAHRRGLVRFLDTREPKVLGRRIELEAMRADGVRIPVELAITLVPGEPTLFAGFLRDISERVNQERALKQAESKYRTLVERLPVVLYIAEPGADGRWTYVSPQIAELTGYEPEMWVADPHLWLRTVHPEDRERVLTAEASSESGGTGLHIEYRMVRRDGEIVWVRDEATTSETADGEVVFEGLLMDITDRRMADERVRYHADHDTLTGLLNRRRFEEELDGARDWSGDLGGAVVIVDVDHFKFVNDSLGHAAGDAVLRRVASALRECLIDNEIPARLGGDEFAVLLPGADEPAARARTAELLRAVRSHESRVPVTASAGIAIFGPESRAGVGDVLVAADLALYEAKQAGRDRAAVFAGQEGHRLTWVGRVRSAIEENRLILYAQPIVDLASGAPAGEELLVRMLEEDGEVVPPGSFLPTAERFGLIREIDRWVVSRAVELASAGRRVNVNLSGRSVCDPDLTAMVERELAGGGTDPALLVFEITETAAVADMRDVVEFAGRVERLGCGLALDDFGTGFGSLTYLKHLPVTELKIDMEFVRPLAHSEDDQRLVRSIVAIAQGTGILTVAEGVEDAATLALLRELGVDRAQGYHLGVPQPVVPVLPSAASL